MQSFRSAMGLSLDDLAIQLGVRPVTVHRWETGSAYPSPVIAAKLQQLGFGTIEEHDTNIRSTPRLTQEASDGQATVSTAEHLRRSASVEVTLPGGPATVLPSPWVRNGPPDQVSFHTKLIELQTSSHTPLGREALARRLAMVERVDGVGQTALFLLERPRPVAVAWNSNYGSHGWHRYVGRFPPHVVRALLNHFGADATTVVCDPFAGSGTTAVECRLLGIPFLGIEICPLSCLMTRTKAAFPADPKVLQDTARSFATFYDAHWNSFLDGRDASQLAHEEVIARKGNPVPSFANVERWFTPEALLGVSITVQFGMSLEGFARDATFLALSSKMRSIGNVDVDVVRAEYSKLPRKNVDVRRLVVRQLNSMVADVDASVESHKGLIGTPAQFSLHEASVLDVDLPENSIDHVITSPPYGIEAINYLRTHLLSYRSLVAFLAHDPYATRDKTIGSEYIADATFEAEHRAERRSTSCQKFFSVPHGNIDSKYKARSAAMVQFFDDMLTVGERLSRWVKDDGMVAFIIGNKRLGDDVIPTDTIVGELFASCGFRFCEAIRHKLKTNNSNSQVPWQERIIQEEAILIFQRSKRTA